MSRLRTLVLAGLVAAELLYGPATRTVGGQEERLRFASQPQSFDQLVFESIERMHREMMVSPSGDADRDFARMMIPHHAGAVEMAKAELVYGRNQILRRLAESIVVEQNQEIEVMRRALAELSSDRNLTSGSSGKEPHQLSHGPGQEQAR